MNISLKKLRISNNETQNDLANFLGVSRTTYLKYENGLHEPSFETLTKLADHFNVSVDYLLGKTNQKEKHQEKKTTDEDIKVALFGGDEEVTDEMWEEVKNFVAFVKGKNKK